ncbi:hypothetical protein A2886_00660 [candidate division WWE3 bacterium RIFCSPHIGHO2_01_FULL_42_13]|uniref:VTT domain-containing protein n=1 Tax=candidate division WWE3 bacterium RIFCSPHIGHO2_01_FULL_42_13 TaxID=1802617 RepID=A0A1F4UQB9_UNCKA|nr:MAG: hypothetical protein A2886_00660 [candidate division WWE3 bacterium RIFCSPHIGHO2_01_FULL_42_13]
MFTATVGYLTHLATKIPVTIFVTVGAFVEEVIAPIPSPLVMTLAGSIAEAQGRPVVFLLLLALLGAAAKTLGSWVVYFVSDKAEDLVLGKFGKFLGVSHKEVEGIGKLLSGGIKDDLILFLLRAIPIVPTAPVSIVSGLLKLKLRTYLNSTFWGTLVRNILYLYLGFSGFTTLESLNEGLETWESVGYVIIFALLAVLVIWFYQRRRSGGGDSFIENLQKRFKR